MEGLSEDQKQALAEAKAALRSAQAIIDELEQVMRVASLKKMLRERSVRRFTEAKNKITPVFIPDRQDYPKPASRMLPEPSISLSMLLRKSLPPPLPEPGVVRETYNLVKSFYGFAATHSLTGSRALEALKQAGINIIEEVALDWDNGTPIRELSRRHGPGRDTIARWIRKTGREIKPGNGNRTYDEALIVATYKETRSGNRAAQVAGVSWDTARSILRRHGLWVENRK